MSDLVEWLRERSDEQRYSINREFAALVREAADEIERLQAERDALRKRATCGCGDEFTDHDPGTCGNCLAAITAGTDALRVDAERWRAMRKELVAVDWEYSDPPMSIAAFRLHSAVVMAGPEGADAIADAAMQRKEQGNA